MENYWPLFYWSFTSFVFVCKRFYKLFENTLLYLMPCISYHGSINLNSNISHDTERLEVPFLKEPSFSTEIQSLAVSWFPFILISFLSFHSTLG